MIISELIQAVRSRGIAINETRIRFALREGRLQKPKMDASHRYVFTDSDVEAAADYFQSKMKNHAEIAVCR